MRKYGVLRIKITLLITMLLLLVSIITSVVLINNANKGFNQIYLSEAEPPAENYEDIYTSATAEEDITGEYGIAKPAPAIMSATLINTSSNFSKTTIIYMFSITLVASVSTWIIMGYSLKKINVLNKEIKTIGENNFTIDIEKFAGNDEVSELATSFQNMLSKLEKAFLVQKNFV
ncbi:MAG: HAMP domain-containing protein, partial [Anaerotignaceae bacterium]